jgi:protein-tyrosine phosphatase
MCDIPFQILVARVTIRNAVPFAQDWPYPDGDPPPDQIIDSWLSLIHATFAGDSSKSKIARVLSKATSSSKASANNGVIGIHCIAGLGRLYIS